MTAGRDERTVGVADPRLDADSPHPVAKLKRMLKIRGLRKSFGSVVAADDIDLSVAPGEALGIIGPNGAGKTTLFNLIAGGLVPDAGEIRLNGRDITSARPHERCIAGIGRSHQIPRPFENLTVFENLLVGGGAWRGSRPNAPPLRRVRRSSSGCICIARANTLAGALTLAGTQAAGDGARARHQPRSAAARRDRRRADRGRVPRTGRDHPASSCRGNDDHLDRAHRARAAGGGRQAERTEFREEDRRGRSAGGDGFRGGSAILYRPRWHDDPAARDPWPHRPLRRLPGAVRHRHRDRAGRDHCHHRRQRGRQVLLPQGHRRPHPSGARQRAVRGQADRRAWRRPISSSSGSRWCRRGGGCSPR